MTRCWQLFFAVAASSHALLRMPLRTNSPRTKRGACRLQAASSNWEKFFVDVDGFGKDEFVQSSRADINEASEGTYGELLPASLTALFNEPIIRIGEDDVVYDLGSGVGKIVAQFAFETECKRAIGVELGSRRHEDASTALARMVAAGDSDEAIRVAAEKIQLISADLLDVPWDKDATILFINAFCFPPALMKELERRVKAPRPDGSPQLKYIFLFGQRFRHDMTTAVGGHYVDFMDASSPATVPEDEEPPGRRWPFNLYPMSAPMTFSDQTEVQLYVSHAQIDQVFSP